MEHDHEHQIKHQIDHGADQQEIQRGLAVAHGAQNGRHGVIQKLKHHAHGVDGEVGHGLVKHHAGLYVHKPLKQRAGEQTAGNGEHQPDANEQNQRRGYRAAQLMLAPGAEKLGDHDAGAVAEADGKGQKNQRQRAGGAGGGQRVLRHEVADHDAVHGVVKLLQKVAGHDGKGKQQNVLPLRAGGHIVSANIGCQDDSLQTAIFILIQ